MSGTPTDRPAMGRHYRAELRAWIELTEPGVEHTGVEPNAAARAEGSPHGLPGAARAVFDLVARGWARLVLRRQPHAVALKPADP
jgi:hypothetical protein